jgi:hypothetical protein
MPVPNEVVVAKEIAVDVHPLLSREVRPMRNWREWLKLWNEAMTYQQLISLLHVGFDVIMEKERHWDKGEPEYTEVDRLVLYFSVADGWNDERAFRKGRRDLEHNGYDEHGKYTTWRESGLCRKVAAKAFELLCSRFFTLEYSDFDQYKEDWNYKWVRIVASPVLFPIIQKFWRAEEGLVRICISNLRESRLDKPSHHEERAFAFLVNLANFIWTWRKVEGGWSLSKEENAVKEKCDAEMRARLDAAKPWMVEILSELDRLDVLEKWIFTLDDSCIEKLKEIALRKEFSDSRLVAKERKVESVEEALLLGSKAAMFLKRLEVVRKERKRLSKIRELELEAEAAQEKLDRVRGKKK